jgi:hypothetical protein
LTGARALQSALIRDPQSRSTGPGIAYNLAVMIFGGFARFIVTWLIEATGSPIAPSFYVMFGAAVGIAATFFLVDRAWDARLERLESVPDFHVAAPYIGVLG